MHESVCGERVKPGATPWPQTQMESSVMDRLNIEYMDVAKLSPHPANARTHSKKQITQISRSLRKFGFRLPILVRRDGVIIAGHGRVDAAKLISIERVPVVFCDGMSDDETRAYMIADNKLAENADWDMEALGDEFKSLFALDLDFDLTITGFEMPEIDFLIDGGESLGDGHADHVPQVSGLFDITTLGDIWEVGRHRVMCGDARDHSCFEALLDGRKADVVFTDPPYNVKIDGNVCGLGTVRHREFAMASGEMSEDEFVEFLETVFSHMTNFTKDGSIHFVCMDWRHIHEMLTAGRTHYSELKNICVWNKTNGGMGSLYRSKHELVAVYKNGKGAHTNNVQLGKHGRNRTNVWDYPGISSFTSTRDNALTMHPTVKPVNMIADALLDCSKRCDIVLDCFGGSGSTLIAAEQTGRDACVMEIDPAYVDVIIRRFQEFTGECAHLVESGTSFNDIDIVLNGEQETSHAA